jgi:Predicted membrane protein (DUF2306)
VRVATDVRQAKGEPTPSVAAPARPVAERPAGSARRARQRRSALALGLLALVIGVFILLDPGKFVTLNPNFGRLQPALHPAYFPILLVHVFGGTLAMIAAVLQVWPWLRKTHPRVHRSVGRVYAANAWPVGLAAITTSVYWPFSPVSAVSDITHAVFWLSATSYGFLLARQRRFAEHWRWMLRSFVLCTSIIINRVMTVPMETLTTWLGSRVTPDATDIASVHPLAPGSHEWLVNVSGIDSWLCWVVPLILLEWWLDRDRRHAATPGLGPATPAR